MRTRLTLTASTTTTTATITTTTTLRCISNTTTHILALTWEKHCPVKYCPILAILVVMLLSNWSTKAGEHCTSPNQWQNRQTQNRIFSLKCCITVLWEDTKHIVSFSYPTVCSNCSKCRRLCRHKPVDTWSSRWRQCRQRSAADHSRLEQVAAWVHRHCWPASHADAAVVSDSLDLVINGCTNVQAVDDTTHEKWSPEQRTAGPCRAPMRCLARRQYCLSSATFADSVECPVIYI